MVKMLLIGNFVAPVLVIVVFINPLAKDFIVPNYLSEGIFLVIKIVVVLLVLILRASTLR